MERNIDMKEVSDGRLYTSNDLVKADYGGCGGAALPVVREWGSPLCWILWISTVFAVDYIRILMD